MQNRITLRLAAPEDSATVRQLYRAVKTTPGCCWDEEYPNMENIREDLAKGQIWLAVQGTDPVGVISVVGRHELDDLPYWQKVPGGKTAELARLAVSPALQGQGVAGWLMGRLLEKLTGQGYGAVHLLAAVQNPIACAIYRRLGFTFYDTVRGYGMDFYPCEKRL